MRCRLRRPFDGTSTRAPTGRIPAPSGPGRWSGPVGTPVPDREEQLEDGARAVPQHDRIAGEVVVAKDADVHSDAADDDRLVDALPVRMATRACRNRAVRLHRRGPATRLQRDCSDAGRWREPLRDLAGDATPERQQDDAARSGPHAEQARGIAAGRKGADPFVDGKSERVETVEIEYV